MPDPAPAPAGAPAAGDGAAAPAANAGAAAGGPAAATGTDAAAAAGSAAAPQAGQPAGAAAGDGAVVDQAAAAGTSTGGVVPAAAPPIGTANDPGSFASRKAPGSSDSGCWYRFTQQKLPAWQPVLTPRGVVVTFYLLALVLGVVGSVVYGTVSSVTRLVFDYSSADLMSANADLKQAVSLADGTENIADGSFKVVAMAKHNSQRAPTERTTAVQFEFSLSDDVKDDLYVYYGLTGFYQNIRRYVRSRDDRQLSYHKPDDILDVPDSTLQCPELKTAPGGANYVFSDRYLMEVFEDGKWRPVHVATDVRDIGWYSRYEMDVGSSKFFQQNPEAQVAKRDNMEYQQLVDMIVIRNFPPIACQQRHPENGRGYDVHIPPAYLARKPRSIEKLDVPRVWDCEGYQRFTGETYRPAQCFFTQNPDPSYRPEGAERSKCADLRVNGKGGLYEEARNIHWGVESGHFINWMHIAGLSTFQKLWGVVKWDGPNNIGPKRRVRVTIYSSFDMRNIGKKQFVLSTKSWLGGRNMALAYAYLGTALVCLLFAFYFTYCYIQYPRKLGDIRDLEWVKRKIQ